MIKGGLSGAIGSSIGNLLSNDSNSRIYEGVGYTLARSIAPSLMQNNTKITDAAFKSNSEEKSKICKHGYKKLDCIWKNKCRRCSIYTFCGHDLCACCENPITISSLLRSWLL